MASSSAAETFPMVTVLAVSLAHFLGVEDKTVVLKKCGPSIGYESDSLTRRDALLGYLGASDGSYKPYRVGGSGDIYGVAQCVQDLSANECQDCLSDAIGRLKTDCGPAASGDLFLAKCYVRFSDRGAHSHGGNDNNNDDEIEKTLAILVGLIAGVALLIVFLSFLRKCFPVRRLDVQLSLLQLSAYVTSVRLRCWRRGDHGPLPHHPGPPWTPPGMVAVTRNLLKPFVSVVPFCLFLLMDIYWKYETRPSCGGNSCTPSEHLSQQKSIMKSQRNALLIAVALAFYWQLYSVTNLVVKIEQLNQRIESERLKNKD
ncbi:hypothetical protein GH714_042167 [Hevea brasiliensis]|uniref:Gnk2-homologous domain-containing protein n=1 Tax=Hevea brasiliensis TaxID=3981 RepID=A0A6A6MWV3_HEVBR|nr:hypothetical protein GH714_042167 [Hevea brasiliensis]